MKRRILLILFLVFSISSCNKEDLDTETYRIRYAYDERGDKIDYLVEPNIFCIGFDPEYVTDSSSSVEYRTALLARYNLIYTDTAIIDTMDILLWGIDTANTVIALTKNKIGHEEAYALANKLMKLPDILFANPFLKSESESRYYGMINIFSAKKQSYTTKKEIVSLLETTKTTITDTIGEDTYRVEVSKESGKDALDMSNEFFKTRKFKYCEPGFFKLKSSKEIKDLN